MKKLLFLLIFMILNTSYSIDPITKEELKNKKSEEQPFEGRNLKDRDFSNVTLKGLSFKNCNLEGVSFEGSKIINCDFSSAILKNANFKKCLLLGKTSFLKTDVKGINLEGATIMNIYCNL